MPPPPTHPHTHILPVVLPPSTPTPSASQKGGNKLAAFLAATATKDVALQQALQQAQGQGLGAQGQGLGPYTVETDLFGPRSTKETETDFMVNPYNASSSSMKSTASSGLSDKGPGLGEVSEKGGVNQLQHQPAGTGGATASISTRKTSAVLSAITALQTKGVQVEVRQAQPTLSITLPTPLSITRTNPHLPLLYITTLSTHPFNPPSQ